MFEQYFPQSRSRITSKHGIDSCLPNPTANETSRRAVEHKYFSSFRCPVVSSAHKPLHFYHFLGSLIYAN